jgi:hypothetical protein
VGEGDRVVGGGHLVPRRVWDAHEASWLDGIQHVSSEPGVPMPQRLPAAGVHKLSWVPLEAGEGSGSARPGTAVNLGPRVGVVDGVVVVSVSSWGRERALAGRRLSVLVLASWSGGRRWLSQAGVVHGVIYGIHGPALIGRLDRRSEGEAASTLLG